MDFSALATEALMPPAAINMNRVRFVSVLLAVMSSALLLCGTAAARSAQLQGVINGRSGNTMTVQTSSGNATVALNSDPQGEDVRGAFHVRKKQMGVTALLPGLSVQVKGSHNGQNQLVADTVKFNGKALQTATDIQAGMAPVQREEQQQIAQQQGKILQQHAQIQATDAEQAKHEQEIEQDKAAVAAVNKRFGELGEYNMWDGAGVLFANGSVKVDQPYIPKLLALYQKAKTVTGDVIQVQRYASKVGPVALNQKLAKNGHKTSLTFWSSEARFR